MSEYQRYRRGNQKLVSGMIQAGVEASIGDFCALLFNYVVPASLVSSPADLAASFLGVLTEGGTSGTELTDTSCLVATAGVHAYPLPTPLTQTYPIGTSVEGVANVPYTLPQQVQVGASTIAVLAKQGQIGDNFVEMALVSTVMATGSASPPVPPPPPDSSFDFTSTANTVNIVLIGF